MLKVRKLLDSFNYALAGITYSLTTQRNMKIHTIAAIIVLLLGLWVDLNRVELLILFLAVFFVLVTEMLNTAIEAAVDIAAPDFHPLAKIAKNVAAGAVLLAAINSLVVGFLLFYDKATPTAFAVFSQIKRSPIHITITIIFVFVLGLLMLKANHRAKGARFGLPNSISAVAFALSTAILFQSENLFVSLLSIFIACLVAYSRLEADSRSLWEIAAGALLGSLVTVLLFQLYQ